VRTPTLLVAFRAFSKNQRAQTRTDDSDRTSSFFDRSGYDKHQYRQLTDYGLGASAPKPKVNAAMNTSVVHGSSCFCDQTTSRSDTFCGVQLGDAIPWTMPHEGPQICNGLCLVVRLKQGQGKDHFAYLMPRRHPANDSIVALGLSLFVTYCVANSPEPDWSNPADWKNKYFFPGRKGMNVVLTLKISAIVIIFRTCR
jgi:hypothetical protein